MPHPRLHHRLTGCLAAAALLALGPSLAGCDSGGHESSEPESVSSSTSSPVNEHDYPFESDQEAFEAAKAAYLEFLKTTDQILQDGGKHPERIKRYAAGEALASTYRGAKKARDRHAHAVGRTTAYNFTFQSRSNTSSPTIVIDACMSVENAHVVGKDGESTESVDRDPYFPVEVHVIGGNAKPLVVSKWTDKPNEGICD